MTDAEQRLRDDLAEARFHNKVLTWVAAFLLLALLVSLAWR
jgi:hypothetical protein